MKFSFPIRAKKARGIGACIVFRAYFWAILSASIFIDVPLMANANPVKEIEVKNVDINSSAKKFRKEMDEYYEKSKLDGTLKSQGLGVNSIEGIALKYLPIGSNLEDAEVFLRAAGFTVGVIRLNPLYPSIGGRYVVSAVIQNFKASELFSSVSANVYLYVSVEKKSAGVEKVIANITKRHL